MTELWCRRAVRRLWDTGTDHLLSVLTRRGVFDGCGWAHRNFKRRARARAAKTGESYTAALRHFRPTPTGEDMPEATTLRIAVTQSTVHEDPTNAALLRESGAEVRSLMKQAAGAGARLVHFTEGAICFPSKRVMSELGPDEIGPSDWSKAEWSVLHERWTASPNSRGAGDPSGSGRAGRGHCRPIVLRGVPAALHNHRSRPRRPDS